MTPFHSLVLAARLALRDLRGGFQGLAVFIGCLAIGVAAIVAVDTIARGLDESLAREGRTILGGDISWSLPQREADRRELAFFERLGAVSVQATARAMARTSERQTLAEVKAVGTTYPLAGTLATTPPASYQALFALRDGAYGAVAEQGLLEKLGLDVGSRFKLAGLPLEIRARLDNEPDKLSGGIGFGPRLLMSLEAVRASELLRPGSLVRWTYRVSIKDVADDRLQAIVDEARQAFPDAGWEARTRRNASRQLASNITRFTQFLDLVGLTALLIGGVGVANAAAAQIQARRPAIATLKALGGTGGFATLTYLIQAGLVALIGVAIGMAAGLTLPFALVAVFADLLPLRVTLSVHAQSLVLAGFYGLAIAFSFAIWSLGEAHDVPVQSLYRDDDEALGKRPRLIYLAFSLTVAALVLLVATLTAEDWRIPAIYAGAAIAAFVVLRLASAAIVRLARALPPSPFLALRLAVTSLHRPGAPTAAVVLSLGLGLTLLTALGLIDANLRRLLLAALPEQAPTFYFLDIRSSEWPAFQALIKRVAPEGKSEAVPLLRGRIVKLNQILAEDVKAAPDAAWALSGDRGITVAETLPTNARLVDGAWWEKDDNRALVSFEEKIAKGLGLKVGDAVTVNVLGRNITATIANTRTVKWETLGINFVMLFSPATFRGAPMSELATLTLPPSAGAGEETRLLRQIGDDFPAVTAIRVREALETVNAIVAKLAVAVRGAAGVAVIASLLVLGGAMAASHRARLHDAAILKTLGASRLTLLAALASEFALLGLVTALIGIAAGHGVAWMVVSYVMRADFSGSIALAATIAVASLLVTLGFGLAGTWQSLSQRPSRLLRAF